MANKQYIYSGNGSPDVNGITPDVATAHYVDAANNDVWMWNGLDWVQVYVGGSDGSIASFNGYNAPQDPPIGPSIYTAWGGGNFRMYIAIFKSGEYWDWEEVQLVTNVAP